MTKLKTKIKFTYEDYKSLPESETKRYELLEGELVMVPSPNEYHQRISRKLGTLKSPIFPGLTVKLSEVF